MRKIVVDQESCTGCGLCVTNVPDVFRFADHGKTDVYDPGGAYEITIQEEAIDISPVSCIQWQE
ncbi:MAG: ferredoxin [Geobacteraceae bacterium]|nr:ferredoxin [Geobacteraceae bacterium]